MSWLSVAAQKHSTIKWSLVCGKISLWHESEIFSSLLHSQVALNILFIDVWFWCDGDTAEKYTCCR